MKITVVTETYPPEVNGVAMTLQRLVEGLKQRGHEMRVARPRQPDDGSSGFQDNIYNLILPGCPIPKYDGLRFGLPAKRQFRQRWHAAKPDIVHVATEGPLGWSAIRVAHELEIPVSSSYHTHFSSYSRHYNIGFLRRGVMGYLRYIHNQTRATFVPSMDVLNELEKEGFKNLRILGRGVDTELFSPDRRNESLRREWGADDSDPVAVYVGRIAKEKNLDLTIKAYEAMRGILPRLKMVLVGDGPERESLSKKYPDIHFSGMRKGQDLACHYASADFFLFASLTETFGNVLTEAMASGLLALSYDYAAAQRFIRSSENGIAVAYGNEKAYLDAAETLARDPDGWSQMRNRARESVKEISWSKIVSGFESDLMKIANKANPADSNDSQKA